MNGIYDMEMLNILELLEGSDYDSPPEEIALINNFYSIKSVRQQIKSNGHILRYTKKYGTT